MLTTLERYALSYMADGSVVDVGMTMGGVLVGLKQGAPSDIRDSIPLFVIDNLERRGLVSAADAASDGSSPGCSWVITSAGRAALTERPLAERPPGLPSTLLPKGL